MESAPTVRPGIDKAWLDRAFASEPLTHAFGVWDLAEYPDRADFLSCHDGKTTIGYLLLWKGNPAMHVVHWVGGDRRTLAFLPHLPSPPLVAIVPDELSYEVRKALAGAPAFPILGQLLDPRAKHLPEADSRIRPLTRADLPTLSAWATRQADPIVSGYATVDLDRERVWGAFDRDDLVGVARAQVRHPALWVLGGVYVAPKARHHGFGLGLTVAGILAAKEAGARTGLWVREDNWEARDLYDALGFRTVERRSWIEARASARA